MPVSLVLLLMVKFVLLVSMGKAVLPLEEASMLASGLGVEVLEGDTGATAAKVGAMGSTGAIATGGAVVTGSVAEIVPCELLPLPTAAGGVTTWCCSGGCGSTGSGLNRSGIGGCL